MSKTIGHYEIIEELGRGGMGVVYKAHEHSLARFVAIKMLGEQVVNDPDIRSRFVREAKSAASLNHPNVIAIYFVGEDQGLPFFAMEYVSGVSLSDVIRKEKQLDPKRAASIILQAAGGLASAHDKGIVHRDIKPANIMLSKQGLVKLADFGIAHVSEVSEKLTATGQLLGTPGYLSPEVCLGKPVEKRSDIFALGIVYYEMLTGKTPFRIDSPLEMLQAPVNTDIPDVRALNAQADLDTHLILSKMVAKDPDERYQDCHHLEEDLKKYLGGHTLPLVLPVVADPTPALDKTMVIDQEAASLVDETVVLEQTQATVPAPDFSGATVPINQPVANSTDDGTLVIPPPMPAQAAPPLPHQPPPHQPPVARVATPQKQKKKSRLIPVLAVALLLLVLGGFMWQSNKDTPEGDTTEVGERTGNSLVENPANLEQPNHETNLVGSSVESDQPDGSSPDVMEEAASSYEVGRAEEETVTGKAGDSHQLAEASGAEASGAEASGAEASGAEASGAEMNGHANESKKVAVESTSFAEVPTERGHRQPFSANAGLKTVTKTTTALKGIPANPKLGLIVAGDQLLGGPITESLSQLFDEEGYSLIDEDMLPSPDGRPQIRALGEALSREGGDVLVLAQITHLDEQDLQYMGRTTTQYTADVVLKCWFPDGNRALGKKIRKRVTYTSFNAGKKGEETAIAAIDELLAGLKK